MPIRVDRTDLGGLMALSSRRQRNPGFMVVEPCSAWHTDSPTCLPWNARNKHVKNCISRFLRATPTASWTRTHGPWLTNGLKLEGCCSQGRAFLTLKSHWESKGTILDGLTQPFHRFTGCCRFQAQTPAPPAKDYPMEGDEKDLSLSH